MKMIIITCCCYSITPLFQDIVLVTQGAHSCTVFTYLQTEGGGVPRDFFGSENFGQKGFFLGL